MTWPPGGWGGWGGAGGRRYVNLCGVETIQMNWSLCKGKAEWIVAFGQTRTEVRAYKLFTPKRRSLNLSRGGDVLGVSTNRVRGKLKWEREAASNRLPVISALFWDSTQYRLLFPYWRLGTTYPSHLQRSRSPWIPPTFGVNLTVSSSKVKES